MLKQLTQSEWDFWSKLEEREMIRAVTYIPAGTLIARIASN
jgi:hypothetical protein